MEKITLTINGQEVYAKPQQTILEVVQEQGLDEIPTLCYDPKLPPYGACFLCVVEVEGRRTLVPSCSTRVEAGMVVQTKSEKIRQARKACLELILSDHYADCLGPCRLNCPAGVDVQGYVSLIHLGQYQEAIRLIKETNPLPLICGRVCVRKCEVGCRRGKVDEAVGINDLKRYVADWDLARPYIPELKALNGKRVAVVGGGPSGLTCAYFLRREGYSVTIFEALPKLGGMLRYGIPEYRLPKNILDQEIDWILHLGIEARTNLRLGSDFTLPDLFQNGYQAIFLAMGAHKATPMGIEGEGSPGVLPGIDFLRSVQLTGGPSLKGRVVVVGGGNTAIDAARTALRLGADEVTLLYRRTLAEMPAHSAEVKATEEEGVNFIFLSAPRKVIIINDRPTALECIRMALGEADESGRKKPVPIKGSEYILSCNQVISAIGQDIDQTGLEDKKEGRIQIEVTRRGSIAMNSATMETSHPGVFAGGVVVLGPASAVEAIAQGRRAAMSIHRYLSQSLKPASVSTNEFYSKKDSFGELPEAEFESFSKKPRETVAVLPVGERRHNFQEVEKGFREDQVRVESSRCLECGCDSIYDCLLRKYAMEYRITHLPYLGAVNKFKVDDRHPFIRYDPNKCIRCGRCVRTCEEILDVAALGFVYRGFQTIVRPSMEKPLLATNCIACGNCLSACPTGALSEKIPYPRRGPWPMEEKLSLCHYCSVGCHLKIKYLNEDLFFVDSAAGGPNDGTLCFKGKFGAFSQFHSHRDIKPKIKRGKAFSEVSWEEALNFVAEALMDIKKNYGPHSIALLASPHLSNEELYLIQRLGREVLGTSHIDSFSHCLRSDALHALDESFGVIASTNAMAELSQADVIFVVNSDPLEEHPVLGFAIRRAVKRGVSLVVIHSRGTEMARQAHLWLDARKGSATVLLNGIMKAILRMGRQNEAFIDRHTVGFSQLKDMLEETSLDEVSHATGVSLEKIHRGAEMLSHPKTNVLAVYNIDYPADKSENDLHALANLLLLTGKVGRIANGLLLLRDHCNSQGLMDAGVGSDGGLRERMQDGKIRACLIFGENPLKDFQLKRYFDSGQLLIVQDVFLTETALAGDVFLPASTALETSGSYTNFEGRLQKFSRIFPPPNGMENWQVLCRLAEKLGHPWPYRSPEEILEEILRLADQSPVKEAIPLLHRKAQFFPAPPSMAVPRDPSSSFCSLCESLEVFKQRRLML
ncbi:MAG: molybdopterin-dependent oxidoreductase [Deltaproteobacteria bacterium]|nr:molybdopterin-dependent oxidoreductase [Deltaproteobacteria bacterium]